MNKKLSIKGNLLDPLSVKIELEDGVKIPFVRGFELRAGVDGDPELTIRAYCTEVDLELLQKNTELKITVLPQNA